MNKFKTYKVKGLLEFEGSTYLQFSTEITTDDISKIEEILDRKYKKEFSDKPFILKIKKVNFLHQQMETK